MNSERKRKKYFIDRSFQTKFILKFCVVVVISSMFVGGLIFLLSQGSTTVAIENSKVMVKKTSDFLLPTLVVTVIVVSVFSALVVLILTLVVSHKISGPLYRLKKEIDYMKEGDFTRNFNIREDDQLKEVSKSLSEMSGSLRQRHIELRDKIRVLKNHMEEERFSSLPEEGNAEERSGLYLMVKEINGIVNYFKV